MRKKQGPSWLLPRPLRLRVPNSGLRRLARLRSTSRGLGWLLQLQCQSKDIVNATFLHGQRGSGSIVILEVQLSTYDISKDLILRWVQAGSAPRFRSLQCSPVLIKVKEGVATHFTASLLLHSKFSLIITSKSEAWTQVPGFLLSLLGQAQPSNLPNCDTFNFQQINAWHDTFLSRKLDLQQPLIHPSTRPALEKRST